MNEPVINIGAVFTSLKLAVTAVITVIALQLELSEAATASLVAAGAAITIAIGDVLTYLMTRKQVTPIAQPNLPIGTVVNQFTPETTGVVVAREE